MTNRILIAAFIATLFIPTQTIYAQHDAPAAAQTFKNLTVLKDSPADQIAPAMQFISVSLGVDCAFCHVAGKPEADDKQAKKTAREMITMTAEINKAHFGGRPQMTCYSCHRGSTRPVAIPPVLESDMPVRPAVAPPQPAAGPAPTADQIIEKYVTALGGADTPIDVVAKAPNRRVSITHGQTDSFTAFDGTAGWMGNTGRPARAMTDAESSASALDAEFWLALRLKEIYPQLRRGRPETVAGADCEILNGTSPGHPTVRLYFDKNTGLLIRMVRYAETPLGRMPTQIDYADYRETDGVKTPFRWNLSRPNGRFTIQIESLKNNAATEDSRFAKPAGDIK